MITQILQHEVNKLTRTKYAFDKEHPPKFTVSILRELDKSHLLILTCIHCGSSVSSVLFPKVSIFDYEALEEEMTHLFNATI